MLLLLHRLPATITAFRVGRQFIQLGQIRGKLAAFRVAAVHRFQVPQYGSSIMLFDAPLPADILSLIRKRFGGDPSQGISLLVTLEDA